MKKSNFTALVLGTVSGFLFALGMCMALLEEWNAFGAGVVMGAAGLVLGAVTIFIWRRMEHKAPIRWNKRNIGIALFGVLGALVLGVGMCLCLVGGSMVWGTLTGLVGIVLLLMLIPIIKGIK